MGTFGFSEKLMNNVQDELQFKKSCKNQCGINRVDWNNCGWPWIIIVCFSFLGIMFLIGFIPEESRVSFSLMSDKVGFRSLISSRFSWAGTHPERSSSGRTGLIPLFTIGPPVPWIHFTFPTIKRGFHTIMSEVNYRRFTGATPARANGSHFREFRKPAGDIKSMLLVH